ncbi:hypothetical protein B0H14DRAFT_1327133 [Mycena olivaceomarginata]|nr:hypothetical protein B0H14DRAFT_1327133 [Mycena olivaceomarginata]
MLTADEFMAQVGILPYSKRHGFATKLALGNDPQLPKLIEQLLSTTALPSRIPYPAISDDPDTPQFIDLQFPQTTASKSFVQRELGLAMAIAVGRPALPILMEALLHPSTAGKGKVVDACVKFASDEQLLPVYRRCVPAVQASLKERLSKANRRELLASLGVAPPPAQAVVEPELTVLERTLTSCAEYQREDAWDKTTIGCVWPHHHLRNPQYISADSQLNLVEKLFELLETFPPTRSGFKFTYKLPNAISSRFLSFSRRTSRAAWPWSPGFVAGSTLTGNTAFQFLDPLRRTDTANTSGMVSIWRRSSLMWNRLSLISSNRITVPYLNLANSAAWLCLARSGGRWYTPSRRKPLRF